MELTQEYLKKILHYNKDNGNFYWKKKNTNRISEGKIAGSVCHFGYLGIGINRKRYKAHRLAWFYMYGEFPINQIDHINHNRTDNRISNLRCVDNLQNHKNKKLGNNNTSGFNGVYWLKDKKRWLSKIRINGKTIYLGNFINKEDAIKARQEANIKYGFHKNHGKA